MHVGRHIRRNAVAYIALFFAFGGTSFAAVSALAPNSVGTKQIRKGAVTLAKLSSAAQKSLHGRTGAAGTQGVQGAQGTQGIQGPKGATGAAGASALSPLTTGQTETGTYALGADAYVTGSVFIVGVTFQIPLATALSANNVVFVSGASTTNCPGVGQAASGYLCVYQTVNHNIDPTTLRIIDPTSSVAAGGASVSGFLVTGNSVGANYAVYNWGTWAVTG
jgi:hypothetical protein